MGAVIRFIYPTLNVIDETQIYAAALQLPYKLCIYRNVKQNSWRRGFLSTRELGSNKQSYVKSRHMTWARNFQKFLEKFRHVDECSQES